MRCSDLTDLSVEPSVIQRLTPEQKDRLTDILDRYLSGLENGAPPPSEELLKSHPDLAGPLQTYLASLNELHDAAAGFANPSRELKPRDETPPGDERRLGDFRLLREIGRGGMGIVYEAIQVSLGRRVALKVLPFAAVLDSRQVARFKNEAQAAAQLHHPNIVSVFAVGVERGVHYYAMQFIDGQPLDRAIAQLRQAAGISPDSTEDQDSDSADAATETEPNAACPTTCRSFLTTKTATPREYFHTVMRLGIQAAEALEAAHQFGILHRDIKPSNLLLDGDGNLWVADFGLARCQTQATLTRTGDVVGTTRYMSPEQALGQSALVDHRTDIYSLGATLYELIALQPAFPGDDGPALLRRIEQQEPPRLRRLQPNVPVDLETVILKAMAKRQEDRYASAQELADDLRRVCEGKPTLAKPPTLLDHLGKWTRRHHRLVIAVAAVCALAVLGLGASTLIVLQAKVKAERNYERAERHFREAREAVDLFGAKLAERLADVPGAAQVRRELLQETLGYYRKFAEQAKEDPALHRDLAMTYSKIGTIAGEIGSSEESIAAHRSALELFEQLVADKPGEADYRRLLSLCHNNLALALCRLGHTDEARQAYQSAIRLQEELARSPEDGEQSASDLARSHNNLGSLQAQTGDAASAEASFREAIRLQEQALAAAPNNPEYVRNLAASLVNLAALDTAEHPERAARLYERAIDYQKKAAASRPSELEYRGDVALTHNNLGAIHSRLGKLDDAASSFQQAINLQKELVRAAPLQISCRRDLAVSFNNLGLTQSKQRRAGDAESSFRQALDLQDLLVKQNPQDIELRSSLGGIHNNLGIVWEDLKRFDKAAESFRKAVEQQQVAFSRAPSVSRYRLFLSNHYYNYGRVLRQLGRPEEAAKIALARKSLWPADSQRLFTVAEELALAAKAFPEETRPGLTRKQCAEQAVETLRQAAAAGWKPTEGVDRAESFAAIKDHPGFAELVKH